jgi:hypothetical protein
MKLFVFKHFFSSFCLLWSMPVLISVGIYLVLVLPVSASYGSALLDLKHTEIIQADLLSCTPYFVTQFRCRRKAPQFSMCDPLQAGTSLPFHWKSGYDFQAQVDLLAWCGVDLLDRHLAMQ